MQLIDEAGLQVAIARLRDTLGRNNDGEVTLGWDNTFDNAVAALARRVGVNPEIPEEQAEAIARASALDEFRNDTLTLAGIKRRVSNGEAEYLALPKRSYVMISSASIRYDRRLTPLVIDGSRISFLPGVPRRFAAPESLVHSDRLEDRVPFTYCAIRISVRARCVYSAVQAAFDRFDLLRAIWNFTYNHRRWRMIVGGNRPYNDIVAGPVHTLHLPSGTPIGGQYWFDPSYTARSSTKDVARDFERLRQSERRIRSAMKASPLGATVKRILLRYGRALEERSAATAFLRLWGTLEDATGTAENARYETTIRRASFVWPDPAFKRVVLNDLRNWRNGLVHDGSEPKRADEAVEELRQHVERLLLLMIGYPKRYATMQQFVEVLDMPTEPSELRRRSGVNKWVESLRRNVLSASSSRAT